MVEGRALINGQESALADARLAITDEGFVRGDGAFETIGVWDGRPFQVDAHLERLAASLRVIGLPAPDLAALRADLDRLLTGAEHGDGALRVYVTASDTRVLTLTPPPVRPPTRWLVPQPAPWIRPVGTYGPAGVKSMSYGPNMAATRAAQAAGGDDALLISLENLVLEGPTFAVLWMHGETLRAASVELGIVDSISRRVAFAAAREAGLRVEEGRYPLDALREAREVLVCSSVRDVLAVQRVGDWRLPAETPVRDLLSAALEQARRGRPTAAAPAPAGAGARSPGRA